MNYKYCSNDNFEDLASGRVIYHRIGFPNFTARLAQEIFGRCLNFFNNKEDICIYDPCCGTGYMLTVLGFFNNSIIASIIASDINIEAIETAKLNLSLLTEKGLKNRINILEELYSKYKKDSYLEAVMSAERLMGYIGSSSMYQNHYVFETNIMVKDKLMKQNFKADIVILDVPYGNLVSWEGIQTKGHNVLLDNLIPILTSNSVVAICSDKKQKFISDKYIRLEKQFIGKRKFEIFTLRRKV